jgi:hypothetical protein
MAVKIADAEIVTHFQFKKLAEGRLPFGHLSPIAWGTPLLVPLAIGMLTSRVPVVRPQHQRA